MKWWFIRADWWFSEALLLVSNVFHAMDCTLNHYSIFNIVHPGQRVLKLAMNDLFDYQKKLAMCVDHASGDLLLVHGHGFRAGSCLRVVANGGSQLAVGLHRAQLRAAA